MNVLDLRSIRCPLALVTLKRELISTDDMKNSSLKLLFSTEPAMSDIILYLNKKCYQYQLMEEGEVFALIIFNRKKGNSKC
ncbi:hypothetical protein CW745_01565 [Psychromonas sp. psych-6C06]|uniref:sulfurtransferase TusA family protein n=1 Tax=Psychromonas sp. psych-6C06 TaxID=2058089 RepID=UPI000C347173|nr:sulfurtransferase TusA family protein [Psychromonas sp. psych-6C06]PKF63561.1 hypothetical protein CW745_01565 [Psychromonas sp. psych-6C06]